MFHDNQRSSQATKKQAMTNIEWDIQKSDMPVYCPAGEWVGVLGQTDDFDVLVADFELLRKACVCPKCATEVVSSR